MSSTNAVQVEPVVSSMTWETFVSSAQWRILSPARQLWVTAFISNGGDAFAATRAAYTGSEKSLRCMAYQLRREPKIVDALEFFRGGVSREYIIAELRNEIRHSKPGSIARAKFRQMFLKVAGYLDSNVDESEVDEEPEAEPSSPVAASPRKFKVGNVVTQNGQSYRVVEVSADGQILKAEEI